MTAALDQLPLVELIDDYAREMPSYLARMAQQHGPVFRIQWPFLARVYLVGPEANRLVFQTHRDHFSHELGWSPVVGTALGRGLLTMDGAEHARHRAVMHPAFTLGAVAGYVPLMHRVIGRRTADWLARGQVDLQEEVRKIAFDVAAETLLGVCASGQVDRLRDAFHTLLYPWARKAESAVEFGQRLTGARNDLARLLPALIAARRRALAPAEHETREPVDLLTTMVHARDEEGAVLSDVQILAHVNILLVTSHETITSLSAWVLYLLARYPEHLARVRAELDQVAGDGSMLPGVDTLRRLRFLGHVISEVGRLYPPLGVAPRVVVRDVSFAGYTIPAGAQVHLAIAAAHRLPGVFAEPECFDPDRFAPPREEDRQTPFGLVTFGGGPRLCIGVHFAQAEIKALVAQTVRSFALDALEGHEPEQIYRGVTAHQPGGFPVRVSSRL